MFILVVFFFQAEDGIRDLVRSRGLGDVHKRQAYLWLKSFASRIHFGRSRNATANHENQARTRREPCLLYTSDAADERSSVDLGGRRIIKKQKYHATTKGHTKNKTHHI